MRSWFVQQKQTTCVSWPILLYNTSKPRLFLSIHAAETPILILITTSFSLALTGAILSVLFHSKYHCKDGFSYLILLSPCSFQAAAAFLLPARLTHFDSYGFPVLFLAHLTEMLRANHTVMPNRYIPELSATFPPVISRSLKIVATLSAILPYYLSPQFSSEAFLPWCPKEKLWQ